MAQASNKLILKSQVIILIVRNLFRSSSSKCLVDDEDIGEVGQILSFLKLDSISESRIRTLVF